MKKQIADFQLYLNIEKSEISAITPVGQKKTIG